VGTATPCGVEPAILDPSAGGSGGAAEVDPSGRGSFTEMSALFGYALDQYEGSFLMRQLQPGRPCF